MLAESQQLFSYPTSLLSKIIGIPDFGRVFHA
jgi:hypothetical protein